VTWASRKAIPPPEAIRANENQRQFLDPNSEDAGKISKIFRPRPSHETGEQLFEFSCDQRVRFPGAQSWTIDEEQTFDRIESGSEDKNVVKPNGKVTGQIFHITCHKLALSLLKRKTPNSGRLVIQTLPALGIARG
jgi:hypothetical protein